MSDWKDKALIAIAIIICVSLVWYGLVWDKVWSPWSYHNKRYEVTFTVLRIEHSERLWDHTYVWVETYTDEGKYYLLDGRPKFDVGKTYHVVFVDRVRWIFPKGWVTSGVVESSEEVPG